MITLMVDETFWEIYLLQCNPEGDKVLWRIIYIERVRRDYAYVGIFHVYGLALIKGVHSFPAFLKLFCALIGSMIKYSCHHTSVPLNIIKF